jgi:protein STE50
MAFESGTAYPESDADDEYERSVHDSSPVQATDDEASGSESGGSGSEHTPTTYGRMSAGEQGVGAGVGEWTAEECADFVGGLGLGQYAEVFLGEFFASGAVGGGGGAKRGLTGVNREWNYGGEPGGAAA